MSHFSVMVIGEDAESILAPYQENNMGNCPQEYMEFKVCEEEEERNYYETANVYNENLNPNPLPIMLNDIKRLTDAKEGELLLNIKTEATSLVIPTVGSMYKLAAVGECKTQDCYVKVLDVINEKTLTIEKLSKQEEVLIKDKMSYIEYMEKECGYKYSEKDEAFGYYENPNAKWDWWVLGGRWSSFIKLKKGFDLNSVRNDSGEPISYESIKDLRVDSAQVKSIDFDYMTKGVREEAKIDYDIVEKIFKGKIPCVKKTWGDCVVELTKDGADFNRTEISEMYNSQVDLIRSKDVISNISKEELMECGVSENKANFYKNYFEIEKYRNTKEEIINQAGNSAFSTHSMIKDGEWYQKGEMGWFGFSSNEKEQAEWDIEFKKLINSLDPEEWISIIDCHI